jgi:hypothetical protein
VATQKLESVLSKKSERIVVCGHSKKEEICKSAEAFRSYIASIFTSKYKGRYRRTKKRNANIVVLSRLGSVYGHFHILYEPEKANENDHQIFDKAKWTYLISSAVLYKKPVKLSELTKLYLPASPEITELQFLEIQKRGELEKVILPEASQPLAGDPFSVPTVFFRVGWMRFYEGLSEGDYIHGGGAFVREHGYGHEMFNFLPVNGRCYGYVRPISSGGKSDFVGGMGIKLERISASKKDNYLDGVLVVWVSSPPEGGTFVVGWYENATIHRYHQEVARGSNRTYKGELLGYYATAATDDVRRLDITEHVFSVPSGKGGIGQSNVWYADDNSQHRSFRQSILEYIHSGRIQKLDELKSRFKPIDPLLRNKIEKTAIDSTILYFEKDGYRVSSREKDNLGWDLEAVSGRKKLLLEVKGLSRSQLCVELTPNEYAQMQKMRSAYHICVVTNALTSPILSVFSYSPELGEWQDKQKRVLRIAELTGA